MHHMYAPSDSQILYFCRVKKSFLYTESAMSNSIVRHDGSCICPSQNYTCQADNIIRIQWEGESDTNDPLQYSLLDAESLRKTEVVLVRDGLKVKFSRSAIVRGLANMSSSLFILDLTLNGTNVTCEVSAGVGQNDDEIISLCIIGKH